MTAPLPPSDLDRLYAERFADKHEYRKAVWRILVDDYFARYLAGATAVLDLGCGYCEFINGSSAPTRYGMDLNPESVARAAPGVKILVQSCADRWELTDASLDVVFTSNFFEHLRTKEDLQATLREAHRCLKAGGRLIALGPNIRYLAGEYWDFLDHYLALTDLSLGEAMVHAGFSIDTRIAKFLPYTMSHGRERPLWAVRMYLKLPFAWPMFGRQFLVVGRK